MIFTIMLCFYDHMTLRYGYGSVMTTMELNRVIHLFIITQFFFLLFFCLFFLSIDTRIRRLFASFTHNGSEEEIEMPTDNSFETALKAYFNDTIDMQHLMSHTRVELLNIISQSYFHEAITEILCMGGAFVEAVVDEEDRDAYELGDGIEDVCELAEKLYLYLTKKTSLSGC